MSAGDAQGRALLAGGAHGAGARLLGARPARRPLRPRHPAQAYHHRARSGGHARRRAGVDQVLYMYIYKYLFVFIFIFIYLSICL